MNKKYTPTTPDVPEAVYPTETATERKYNDEFRGRPSASKTASDSSFEQILKEIRERQKKTSDQTLAHKPTPKPESQFLNTEAANTELQSLLEAQAQRRNMVGLNTETEQGMNKEKADSASYIAYRPIQAQLPHPVKQLLSTKQGLRQAILAAEILKPKYN